MLIADYALVEQDEDKLYIDVIMYKDFIRIRTNDDGFISIDLSIK